MDNGMRLVALGKRGNLGLQPLESAKQGFRDFADRDVDADGGLPRVPILAESRVNLTAGKVEVPKNFPLGRLDCRTGNRDSGIDFEHHLEQCSRWQATARPAWRCCSEYPHQSLERS